MFRPGRIGDSAGSKVTQQLMGAETSGLEIEPKADPFKVKKDMLHSGLHKIEIGLGTKFQYKFSAWFSRNSYSVW